jgi:histidinol-phosphatase (PHP family)
VAWGFDQLEEYARRFGYTHSVWFRKGVMHQRPF